MNCEFGIEYTAAKTELAMALNSSAKPEESIGVHHNTVEVTSETLPTAGKPPTDEKNKKGENNKGKVLYQTSSWKFDFQCLMQ